METKPDIFSSRKLPSLPLCLLMDIIGCATYAVPVIAEVADVVWAPLSSYLLYRWFGGKVGIAGGIINFIEEAFPGLDFVPTFTLTWVWVRFFGRSRLN
jgi:hypothetical protein